MSRWCGRPVQRLADDLLGRGNRQVGELTSQLGDGAVALEGDLAAGALQHRFRLLLRRGPSLFLKALRDLLGLSDDVLALSPGSV